MIPTRHAPAPPRIGGGWPMETVLFETSTAARLTVRLGASPGNPDPALKLDADPSWPFRRLIFHGVRDACTGCVRSRYALDRGDPAMSAFEFLLWALSEDRRTAVHGVPDTLWIDRGPLAESSAARRLLGALGVGLVTAAPEEMRRAMRLDEHRAGFEEDLEEPLTLSELNDRLFEYDCVVNELDPSHFQPRTEIAGRPLSRTEAWTALARRRPAPLRRLPDEAGAA